MVKLKVIWSGKVVRVNPAYITQYSTEHWDKYNDEGKRDERGNVTVTKVECTCVVVTHGKREEKHLVIETVEAIDRLLGVK